MVYNRRMHTLDHLTQAHQKTLQDAIAKAGSKAMLSRILGVTRAAVTQWRKLPDKRLAQLQASRPEWFNRL